VPPSLAAAVTQSAFWWKAATSCEGLDTPAAAQLSHTIELARRSLLQLHSCPQIPSEAPLAVLDWYGQAACCRLPCTGFEPQTPAIPRVLLLHRAVHMP